MGIYLDIEVGEITIFFDEKPKGVIYFEELGFEENTLHLHEGFSRIIFDFQKLKKGDLYSVPTMEFVFNESDINSHWICEFNENKIFESEHKHSGKVVILLHRKEIEEHIQHHENKLKLHIEFSDEITWNLKDSFIHFFKD
ncbi:hypothetical protein [Aureivirga marina]|uniref:hypothetical protein n=1 Tax=Aureivirga marina TaxID=1182451 RepID=UPI0018CA11BF|nr:hypothetical protein [Aureivirga marina]